MTLAVSVAVVGEALSSMVVGQVSGLWAQAEVEVVVQMAEHLE